MMGIFDSIKPDLPPFGDYLDRMFTDKKTVSIGNKEVLLSKLRDELFDPQLESNQDSTQHLLQLVEVIAERAIKEMTDENKAIHRYISANGKDKAIYSHRHSSSARQESLRGVPATNDNAESALGGATYQLQQFGRIGIKHFAAINDLRRNNWLNRGTEGEKTKKKQKKGLFWLLPQEVQDAIIQSAIEDAPEQRKRNNEELEAQRKAKKAKEDLVREINLHNATEAYIDAIYYHKMYHSSVSCLRDCVKVTSCSHFAF